MKLSQLLPAEKGTNATIECAVYQWQCETHHSPLSLYPHAACTPWHLIYQKAINVFVVTIYSLLRIGKKPRNTTADNRTADKKIRVTFSQLWFVCINIKSHFAICMPSAGAHTAKAYKFSHWMKITANEFVHIMKWFGLVVVSHSQSPNWSVRFVVCIAPSRRGRQCSRCRRANGTQLPAVTMCWQTCLCVCLCEGECECHNRPFKIGSEATAHLS